MTTLDINFDPSPSRWAALSSAFYFGLAIPEVAPADRLPVVHYHLSHGGRPGITFMPFGHIVEGSIFHLVHAQGRQFSRRGVVMADSFVTRMGADSNEWSEFRMASGKPMLIAVEWQSDLKNGCERFAVMTTVAGKDVQGYGDIQPVIVPIGHLAEFLDHRNTVHWIQQPTVEGLLVRKEMGDLSSTVHALVPRLSNVNDPQFSSTKTNRSAPDSYAYM